MVVTLLGTLGVIALSSGCGLQGLGDRCDTRSDNGGNDDCESGLVCTPAAELAGSASDRCCPADRSTAPKGSICALNATPIGGDAAPPDDASSDGASGDSGADTGADAQADAASDAPTDAGDSG